MEKVGLTVQTLSDSDDYIFNQNDKKMKKDLVIAYNVTKKEIG